MNKDTIIPEGLVTFDDGLYSQYLHGRNLPNKKIYFICPSFINKGHNDLNQKCMSISNIKELMADGIEIQAHSYYHTKLEVLPDLKHRVSHIQRDTELMMEWFKTELDYTPTKFCYPYNNDLDGIYKATISNYNFTDFYGSSRVDIPA